MSTIDRHEIVTGDGGLRNGIAVGLLSAALLTFLASWLVLFGQVGDGIHVLGVALIDLLALSLIVQGLGLGLLGLGSYYGYFPSSPSPTSGLLTGFLVGLLWAGTLGGIASVQLGLGTIGWVGIAFLGGVAAFLVVVLPREEIGSTVPIAGLIAPIGLAILAGPLSPPWVWEPGWTDAVFPGSEVLPLLFMAGSVVSAWSVAKAQEGFGARGRQRGAYYLIGTSVAGMLGTLGLIIWFIWDNGHDVFLTGAEIGGLSGEFTIPFLGFTIPWLHVKLPFVTNVPGGLFVEIPGVWPAVLGTIWLVVGAVVVAVPLGIGSAIFLTEYVERGRITQVVEVVTNGLWSTPSIVFGLFGLAFLMPRLSGGGRSLIVGQVVLGFMLLPLVMITSREAILSVPDEYRDASAALGVTRWQTIRSVVLPAAMPGVITGVILGVGRIAGETAPLILVFGGPPFPSDNPAVLQSFEFGLQPPFVTNEALTQAGTALPYQLYTSITAGVWGKDIYTTTEFGWGTALVLLGVVLLFYGIGVGSRMYFERKLNDE